MTVEIPLTREMVALVDDADEALVSGFRWAALESPGPSQSIWYARTVVRTGKQLMHNLLTGWPMVDHINGDGLDNRRANLRAATRSQNMANRRKYRPASSRFKGVSRHCRTKARWIAAISVDGRRFHLGMFRTEEEAALVYDAAARRHFGEFATLNFPEPGERSALNAA